MNNFLTLFIYLNNMAKDLEERKHDKVLSAPWFRDLSDSDEELKASTHESIYQHLPIFFVSGLLMIGGLIGPLLYSHELSIFLIVLLPMGLIIFIGDYLQYITKFYVFTDKRVIKKTGIIATDLEDIQYDKVQGVTKQISVIGRILKFGDIEIETASRQGVDLRLANVPKPTEAYNIIKSD